MRYDYDNDEFGGRPHPDSYRPKLKLTERGERLFFVLFTLAMFAVINSYGC